MEICGVLDHWGGVIGLCEVIRTAQVCQIKAETEQTVLQDYTACYGAVPEQRTGSHFVFECTKWVYR